MVQLRARLEIPDIPVFDGSAESVTAQVMGRAMNSALFLADAELTKRTPVFTGRLRASWSTRVDITTRPVQITGTNINVAPYALYVDQGSEPHWPPWGPGSSLALWVRRTLGPEVSAFVIARKIAGLSPSGKPGGTPARRIVERTQRAIHGPVLTLFRRAQVELARRLEGN